MSNHKKLGRIQNEGIRNRVLEASGAKAGDRLVLLTIADLIDSSGFCRVSRQKLAVIANTTTRSVTRSLRRLEQTGAIRTVSTLGGTNLYQIQVPANSKAGTR